jgi:uridine kinase
VIARFTDLADRVRAEPAGLGPVRVVAVDGPAGAGKTLYAARLAEALRDLGATVAEVHTDDLLDGWDDIVDFWPRLEERILRPLSRGEPAAYRRYDWHAGRFGPDLVAVPPPEVLILEGVTSARRAIRSRLARSVFITAPQPLRLARVLARDGEKLRPKLLRWMAAEADHFTSDATAERVDVVVDGAPAIAHDPQMEYVYLGGLRAWGRITERRQQRGKGIAR